MRVRGLARYRPQRRNIELVEHVRMILEEMAAYLPLTLRQVFYRLVVKQQIDKTDLGYSRLCDVCNRARRAEMIKFSDIRDDGPTIKYGHQFVNEDALKNYVIDIQKTARLDIQSFQDRRVYIWCEAAGMVPQLIKVAQPYGIPVISSGGFDSLTMKHDMAKELRDESVVLHLGDYDPSGVHIFSSLAEDISALGGNAEFIRLAVTPDQRDEMGLPTAPPKPTDNRRFDDSRTVQCEAISPPDLANIVKQAILELTDIAKYKTALEWQKNIRSTA